MLRIALWQIVAILALVAAAALLVVPSFLSPATVAALESRLPSWIPARPITLGLDLQGGAYLLMEVDKASLAKGQVQQLRDDVRAKLREAKIPLTGGVGAQPRGVVVRIANPAERAKAFDLLRSLDQRIGDALSGATAHLLDVTQSDDGAIRLTLTDAAIIDKERRAIKQSIEVLNRRLNASGTKETDVQRQGNDRVVIEAPGIQDTTKLKQLVGTTAKLTFQLVADASDPPSEVETLKMQQGGDITVQKQVMVSGEDLVSADPGFDSRSGEPDVNFRFNLRGGQRFGQVTAQNVGRPFAIVLDNVVISAPRILGPITGGSGQITGNFTVEQADQLAVLLRSGALPAKLTTVEERTVGPGLGQDSIDAGKRAALVGGLMVFVYMLATYGIFGVFADLALAVHILFIFASMVLIGATLTLPGIAGIVFTIGMAVDSNVLIYERIREESHLGRSVISALDAGYHRAFATIIDSNVTMFVAAMILYLFGSGAVRGFAVSLGLGILTSIITAVTMTRMMIALWYRRNRPQRLPI
jgi:SecD/SecF fusion protein